MRGIYTSACACVYLRGCVLCNNFRFASDADARGNSSGATAAAAAAIGFPFEFAIEFPLADTPPAASAADWAPAEPRTVE